MYPSLWESGDNIDFNENLFVDSTSDEIKEFQRDLFISFITQWIARFTNRNINKFSLKVMNPTTYWDTIDGCLAFVTQRGTKDLALDFSDPKWDESNDIYDNHDALFHLTTHFCQVASPLESLKLYSCDFGLATLDDFGSFIALKDVSLGWIELKVDLLKTLLSTCKTIESLSLERCWNMVELDLEVIGLKRLVLHKCDTKIIILDAPNLKYFKFCGAVFRSQICVSPNVIEEVEIDFSIEPKFYIYHASRLCQILIDFKDAKILTVCCYLLQVVPSGEDPVSTISNLNVRHLILKTQMHNFEFCGIEFLLNSCPLMEKLTLDIGERVLYEEDYLPHPGYDVDLLNYWEEYRVLPECLIKTLIENDR